MLHPSGGVGATRCCVSTHFIFFGRVSSPPILILLSTWEYASPLVLPEICVFVEDRLLGLLAAVANICFCNLIPHRFFFSSFFCVFRTLVVFHVVAYLSVINKVFTLELVIERNLLSQPISSLH